MCGICGQIGGALNEKALQSAMHLMADRGPNQEGMRFSAPAMLGHRRLSIIDLSDAGRQPMSNEDGSVWLVFNGEIYNFPDLRSELGAHHLFRSRTDSEVLIHGYEEWGMAGLLQRIRGMFAFALWDERQRTVHLVRDHVGEKPLYYTNLGGGLKFASTLPALLQLINHTPEVSARSVSHYLHYKYIPAPDTIFAEVQKLPPAHCLRYTMDGSVSLSRYWRADFSHKRQVSETEWLERIDASLHEAVRERLIADVPLGVFLSGGVDSSLITALMTHISGRPVTTVSMGFKGEKFDELPYARRVAEHCKSDHHEHVLCPSAAQILPALTFHFGEPFADAAALPTYYLAQMARRYFTVVLTGDGGDESFAGYPTIPAVALVHKLRCIPGMTGGQIADVFRKLRAHGLNLSNKLSWAAEVGRGATGNYVFDPNGARNFREYAWLYGPALSNPDVLRDEDDLYRTLWREAGDVDWMDRAMYVDLMSLLPDDFLVKTDTMTMAHGLEARAPFLDIRLIELTCQIPSQLKTRGWTTKYLLKRLAERYVPKDVLYRRKHGFIVPTSDWLRTDLKGVLRETLLSPQARQRSYFDHEAVKRLINEHQSGRSEHGQRLWSLLMLELWFQMFVDKSLKQDDNLAFRG